MNCCISTPDAPPGVIFVLKNINNEINVDQQNRLHPFYMVYIGQDGSTVCDYLSPKELLDRLRLLCKGKTEPDQSLCLQFNQATDDGKNMMDWCGRLPDCRVRAGTPHTALRRTSNALRNVKNCKSRLRRWRIRFGKRSSSIVRWR